MNLRVLVLALAFLAGYVVNDVVTALGVQAVGPALANGHDFESAVEDVIEDCEVYVYDVDDSEGWGEIDC